MAVQSRDFFFHIHICPIQIPNEVRALLSFYKVLSSFMIVLLVNLKKT